MHEAKMVYAKEDLIQKEWQYLKIKVKQEFNDTMRFGLSSIVIVPEIEQQYKMRPGNFKYNII